MTSASTQEWSLTISTPIGRQSVTLVLTDGPGGLTGEARGRDETVPLHDLRRDGDRLSWSQRITRPMRLDLRFDVLVEGVRMTGTSRAGRLPASTVSGIRTS
jgi:hypothetical protein